MSSHDWRDPANYAQLESLDAPGFAWEYLRRNPEFGAERAKLQREERDGELAPETAEAFARRWGVRFRDADDAKSASSIVWTARALPTVTALSGTSFEIADPALSLPSERLSALHANDARSLLIEFSGALLRAEKLDPLRDTVAVTLPLDRLFEIRVAAALRLWRALSRRKPGRDPAVLSQARLRRLSLGLRALDGRMQRATYREIAELLFEARRLESEQWNTHSLRDQTIRLVRFGIAMMRGRYRLLLLHPYRRRS